MHNTMRNLRPHLPVVLGYSIFGLLLLAPVLAQWRTAIPGGAVAQVDGWQNVWNFWWLNYAVQTGKNPFVTQMIFYPDGVGLHLQPIGITNLVLAWPVTALWGPVAGYNFAIWLGVVLSAVGAYALALQLGATRSAAIIAGLLYSASPYHLTRIYDGQVELAAIQWFPSYLLLLLRVLEPASRWRIGSVIGAGSALALIGYTSWYYLLMAALFSPLLVLLWGRGVAAYVRAGGVALTGLLLLMPMWLPAVQTARANLVRDANPEETLGRATNLFDIVLPSYLHPLWGEPLFRAVQLAWHNYAGDWNAALGYGVIGLALLGSWRAWAQTWRWWALAGLGLIFALGPVLQIGGWNTGVPLPYALFDALPGLSLGRRPHLFVVLIPLALIPLTAFGWQRLQQMPHGQMLTGALALLLMFELFPRPWPLQPYAVHPIFDMLADQPGAVLEVPPARYKYSLPQRDQTAHERPIFGGYLARPPATIWMEDAPVLRELWWMRTQPGWQLIDGSASPPAVLRAYGVRDIVLRWEQVVREQADVAALEAALASTLPGITPDYSDAQFRVYRLPELTLAPFAALVGTGWHRDEVEFGRTFRWMRNAGAISLYNPHEHPIRVELRLRLQSYASPRPLTIRLADMPLGVREIGMGEGDLVLRLWLEPGEQLLHLQAPAEREGGNPDARLLSVVLLEAQLAVIE
jgi:hypothetical protein